MRRRECITAGGAMLGTAVAGCLGAEGTGKETIVDDAFREPYQTTVDVDPGLIVDGDTIEAADPDDLADRADVELAVVEDVLQAVVEFECERRPYKDPRALSRLYYHEGLTQAEIAERFDTGSKTISEWMERHDLSPGRGRGSVWQYVTPTAEGGGRGG